MSNIRFELDEVKKDAESKFHSNHDTFKFHVPSIDDPRMVSQLHELLKGERSLHFANVLLEISGENKISCTEGSYTLLKLQPDVSSKDDNQKYSTSGSSTSISDLFTLRILINHNNKPHEFYIRTVMELNTQMQMEKDSIQVKIRFPGIEKLSKVVVYFTLISLARICENWRFFITDSRIKKERSSTDIQQYTVLVSTELTRDTDEKKMITEYMVHKINNCLKSNSMSKEMIKDLVESGLVPCSLNVLWDNIDSESPCTVVDDHINIETNVSSQLNIFKGT